MSTIVGWMWIWGPLRLRLEDAQWARTYFAGRHRGVTSEGTTTVGIGGASDGYRVTVKSQGVDSISITHAPRTMNPLTPRRFRSWLPATRAARSTGCAST